mmetsp:Transcript_16122/g.22265  ORF Transcript_16122/g.22265 Transcript_16122/m.22265 type:complete len:621 (+) Transcript_16122:56-1918(+)|eukprot:CAMPEP_0196592558 /NCGR_PEP_ID=MMETSP1081-20130531/73066_1 /TAXON_ID=36882 /ORGANISM="Pyramimonas amylifera, Strain CCMP720" /LENGTH=620 /DNA_ID=CAMNT_0041916285 /DNA_START=65 /DNA_END=1927 /DNA_ORIENTATION=+
MSNFKKIVDPETPRSKGATFTFRKCGLTVKTKDSEREILKDITGEARSGELLAIMGPSGAGKTQLLNLLALVDGPGQVTGDVKLNGSKFTHEMYVEYSGMVPQADYHWAFLTCRETVQLAADLLGISHEDRADRVSKILSRTGLEACADTRVGNQFISGLSGGQKRRLSLAVLLLRQPRLVFLDEPTSGLDAAATVQITNFVAELAKDWNLIVVVTIHQPSATVFNNFDSTLILSGGRVAYHGGAPKLVDYLQHIGKPLPPAMGVAEWVLDLVNSEFSDPVKVDAILDMWPKYSHEFCDGRGEDQISTTPLIVHIQSAHPLTEISVLLKRHFILTIRDPTIYVGRAIVNLIACSFFAVVYIESRKYNQDQAVYHMFLTMWYCGVPACMGLIAVFAFNIEFKSIQAEVKNGMYNRASYLIAKSMLELPFIVLLAVFAITVPGYGISNYNGDYYFMYLGVYTVMLWCFECMAQFLSVMFENPLMGSMGFMNMWFCSFLFAGIMVPEADVPWPLKAMIYLFPFRYSLSSLLWIDVHDVNFDGAVLDDSQAGYSCPDIVDDWCFGRTGYQVLDSMGRTYESLSSDDNVLRDVLIMLAIGAFYKIQYIVLLLVKAAAHRVPSPPK